MQLGAGCSIMNNTKGDLEHYIRKMIYNHIIEYPGVSFSTLKRVFDLNDSTLRYHLKYLERTDRITPTMERGQLHYYPFNQISSTPDSTPGPHQKQKLTHHQEAILNAIRHYPGITQKELGKRTSLKRFILTYNLSKLIDLGMVRKNNHSHAVCYEPITDQQLNHEIMRVLTVKLLNKEITEQSYNELKRRLSS